MVLVRTNVSKVLISSIFRAKELEPSWFAAKMYLTTDGKESLVGTSHTVPGVRSRTGYLATEQCKPNTRKRFYLSALSLH
jgi:hypothetical protein